jgi:uncharacterized protein YecE (DUF72 family)
VGALWIGTSGWHYAGWIGDFYPEKTPKKGLLRLYAEHFPTCEINASFYRVPSEKAVQGWHDSSPDGFLFAWKASRFVTHNKKLNDVGESVVFILDRMKGLEEKFGPVLWQLPPNLHRNDDRLAGFLKLLPKDQMHVVEFRHPGWYERPVFDLLADHDVALCISDHHDAPAPFEVTAGHVYIRPHGPGGRYHGHYGDKALGDWAGRIARLRHAGKTVFTYFDNDQKAAAPKDAQRLIDLCARAGAVTRHAA